MNLRKIRKQIHYHSKQRWAITVVLLVIFCLIIYGHYTSWNHVNTEYNKEEHKTILLSLKAKAIERKESISRKYKKRDNLRLSEFNPNTVSKNQLIEMGIKASIAKSWTNYTSKGGKFYKTEDLKKLYVMNDFLFEKIKPFVQIEPRTYEKSKNTKQYVKNEKWDKKPFPKKKYDNYQKDAKSITHYESDSISEIERKKYSENFKASRIQRSSGIAKDYIIKLNTTDSVELQMLDGIGPVLSSRIIKYRDKLGGFHNMNQLLEVYGVRAALLGNIADKISFDGSLKKIDINNITVDSLVKHPYFDYATANIFINYRDHHGPYHDLSDVKKIIAIKQYWLDEASPYFLYANAK